MLLYSEVPVKASVNWYSVRQITACFDEQFDPYFKRLRTHREKTEAMRIHREMTEFTRIHTHRETTEVTRIYTER